MKTLCLGGSFNPIHFGHLICARSAAEAAGFERILLIPSGRPPHKPDLSDLASPSDRLEMCRLALETSVSAPGVRFEVSDIETNDTSPSYTIETVRKLKKSGWDGVDWLIGADMLNYLPKWHESAALLEEAEFVIIARPGVPIDWKSLPANFSKLKANVVAAPLVEISSSEIRQRIKAGRSIDFLTPRGVVEYIRSRGLYK